MTATPGTSPAIKAYSYIRYSTPSQSLGDSKRRQVQAVRAYCATHVPPLELDEELRDEGISARHGRHIRRGAFGRFIERVDQGKIARGSYLIVEALDRISRMPVDEAVELFTRLIRLGIIVVTLVDGKEYSRVSIRANIGDLYASIGFLLGANVETENKSKRVRESWVPRRERVIRMHPGWLCIKERRNGNKKYEVIPEARRIIHRIFRECRNGIGMDKIAERLNIDGVLPFNTWNHRNHKRGGWHGWVIRRLISERKVLGEIELHSYSTEFREDIVNGKRTEYVIDVRKGTGKWIKPYPEVIDEQLWQEANLALVARAGGGGRKGKGFTNLLQRLAVCGSCGGAMRVNIRRIGAKQYSYMRCRDLRRAMCRNDHTFDYAKLETQLMELFGALAYGAEQAPDKHGVSLLDEIALRRSEEGKLRKAYDRAFFAFAHHTPGSPRAENLAALERQLEQKTTEVAALSERLSQLKAKPLPSKQLELVKRLIGEMHSMSDNERYALRARINAGLRTFVSRIVLAREGTVTVEFDGQQVPTIDESASNESNSVSNSNSATPLTAFTPGVGKTGDLSQRCILLAKAGISSRVILLHE